MSDVREMSPLAEGQKEKLKQSIPRSVVRERQGLSYVDQFYVINELNEVFGPDGWSFTVDHGEWVQRPEIVKTKKGDRCSAKYLARVSIHAGGVVKQATAVGHNLGSAFDAGAVAHNTVGEAETDALKRAARLFGIRTGLALYDHKQRFISDGPKSAAKTSEKSAEKLF